MSSIVLDASAVLALTNAEPGAELVESRLGESVISAVNVAEVAGKYAAEGLPPERVRARLDSLDLRVVPFDETQAIDAGLLRAVTKPFGLSLGDRACLTFALLSGLPVLTAERAWARLDLGVEVVLIR